MKPEIGGNVWQGVANELVSVRDVFRFAVSRFRMAGLVHGQGAVDAVDEAAFLVLESLGLPHHDINPWLEARLTLPEREKLLARIRTRIETRKPAAYLTGRTYIQDVPFHVDERVIVPRSYIGEILFSDDFARGEDSLFPDAQGVARVLDLCTGSACLALLAAQIFPNARVDAVELSPEAMEVARLNVEE